MPLDKTDGAQVAFNQGGSVVIKVGSGRVVKVALLNSGTTDGFLHDAATVGEANANNAIAIFRGAADLEGMYDVNMPFQSGLVLVAGTDQAMSISYN